MSRHCRTTWAIVEPQLQVVEQVEIDATRLGVGLHPERRRRASRLGDRRRRRGCQARPGSARVSACRFVVPNMTRSNMRLSNSSTARRAAPTAGIAAVSERNGSIGMRRRYGSPRLGEHVRRRRSDTRRSGTTTVGATMSRLPVAAMPSTCQVSFTSTSSTGTRNIRGIGVLRRPRSSRSAAPSRRGRCRCRTASGPTARSRRRAASPRPSGSRARREHVRLRAEDLVLEVLGEHREQPVVLHVEGRDPARRRVGLARRRGRCRRRSRSIS